MSKNPYGTIRRCSLEWGKKARKREDRQRGLNHRADRQQIAEQVADLNDDLDLADLLEDDGPEALDWYED